MPPGSVGIQQFSIRDSITRLGVNIYDKDGNVLRANPTPTMGFLGGPNYPADPTDLGPSVPLPGGFLETFQFLKSRRLRRDRVLPVHAEHRLAARIRPP